MTLQIGVQMDPIESIAIGGDSTFALLLEAQLRRYSIFYYSPGRLLMRDGRIFGEGAFIQVADVPGAHFTASDPQTIELSGLDAILLRQDPPFDMGYITTTHLLERIHPRTLVVNDPRSVRNAPEKLFVTEFPHLMPATLITRSLSDLRAFRAEFGDIVVKPLYGNGGAGVFHLKPDDPNASALVEMFQGAFREPFVVQQYLPAVRDGDKRIILVDGEAAGAINRIPAVGEARSNMHAGGKPVPAELTARDREICETIGPSLKRLGLIFTGIDVIGGLLTEINVTSPTGIREVKRFGGADIASMLWDVVEAKRQKR